MTMPGAQSSELHRDATHRALSPSGARRLREAFQAGSPAYRYLIQMLLVVVLYVVGGKVGLHLAYSNKNVTAVWPPTGIAVAALLLVGLRVWPAVAVGAFLVNVLNSAGIGTSVLITIGNTLAPVTAWYLLERVSPIDKRLQRLRDVLALIAFGSLLSMALSATLGTASLGLTGAMPWRAYGSTWLTWWVGDSSGVTLITTLALVAWSRPWRYIARSPNMWLQAGALLVVTVLVSTFAFTSSQPIAFLLFPVAVLAAIRFLQLGAVVITTMVATASTVATVRGAGQFVRGMTTTVSMVEVQLFNAAITLRARTAERELQADTEDLERQVVARTEELERSIVELRDTQAALVQAERFAAVGEMVVVVGHEIRNPLTAITNSLFSIGQRLGKDADPALRNNLELAQGQVEIATELMEDLSSYARPRVPTPSIFSLQEVLTEVMQSTPSPPGVSVSFDIDGVVLSGDRLHFTQIATNLLTNSYQAISAAGHVEVCARFDDGGCVMTFGDDGSGVPDDTIARVFDPFFTTKASGTGLGLSIVKRLAEANGGVVTCRNREIGGFEVQVRWPVASE